MRGVAARPRPFTHIVKTHKDRQKCEKGRQEKRCMNIKTEAQSAVSTEAGFIRFYSQISARLAPPTMPVSNDGYFPSDAQISDDPESSHNGFYHKERKMMGCKVGAERGFDTPLCVSQSRAGGKQGGPANSGSYDLYLLLF